MLGTLAAFLGVLIILVIVHELGHFVTAKLAGVRVDEFGVGFPPKLVSVRFRGTDYSINAIPLGGFVKVAGEVDPNVPGGLARKSHATRILVLSAGTLMNAVLPFILLSAAFMLPHDEVVGKVEIRDVIANSPAARAGMAPGDLILDINGKPVRHAGDVNRYVHLNLGTETTFTLQRDGANRTVTVVPRWRPPQGQGATGIAVRTLDATAVRVAVPVFQAIPMGAVELVETFVLFKNAIIGMIVGVAPVQIAGPVGIAQMTGEAARAGVSPLLEFAAFLSLNLAIVNILPLPALDGGRIAFVVLEWVRRGKRVSPKTEGLVHMIGFAMLLAMIAIVTYQDVVRIITGGTLVP